MNDRTNENLKQRLKDGGLACGIMLSELYTPTLARLLSTCGFDFLLVDCEHGYFDLTQVANLIAVAEGCALPVVIRVAQHSQSAIAKLLDMGAHGILLANLTGPTQAKELADMCLYAPDGDRGVSTFRAHTGYNNGNVAGVMRAANARNLVIAQIESPAAIQAIDAILAVEGLDGVLVGPNDLTQHMGVIGQYDHPLVRQAVETVAAAAARRGKWSGVITGNQGLLAFCRTVGMTCFSAGSELSCLADGASAQLSRLRDTLRAPHPPVKEA